MNQSLFYNGTRSNIHIFLYYTLIILYCCVNILYAHEHTDNTHIYPHNSTAAWSSQDTHEIPSNSDNIYHYDILNNSNDTDDTLRYIPIQFSKSILSDKSTLITRNLPFWAIEYINNNIEAYGFPSFIRLYITSLSLDDNEYTAPSSLTATAQGAYPIRIHFGEYTTQSVTLGLPSSLSERTCRYIVPINDIPYPDIQYIKTRPSMTSSIGKEIDLFSQRISDIIINYYRISYPNNYFINNYTLLPAVCLMTSSQRPTCGNGQLDPGEVCDQDGFIRSHQPCKQCQFDISSYALVWYTRDNTTFRPYFGTKNYPPTENDLVLPIAKNIECKGYGCNDIDELYVYYECIQYNNDVITIDDIIKNSNNNDNNHQYSILPLHVCTTDINLQLPENIECRSFTSCPTYSYQWRCLDKNAPNGIRICNENDGHPDDQCVRSGYGSQILNCGIGYKYIRPELLQCAVRDPGANIWYYVDNKYCTDTQLPAVECDHPLRPWCQYWGCYNGDENGNLPTVIPAPEDFYPCYPNYPYGGLDMEYTTFKSCVYMHTRLIRCLGYDAKKQLNYSDDNLPLIMLDNKVCIDNMRSVSQPPVELLEWRCDFQWLCDGEKCMTECTDCTVTKINQTPKCYGIYTNTPNQTVDDKYCLENESKPPQELICTRETLKHCNFNYRCRFDDADDKDMIYPCSIIDEYSICHPTADICGAGFYTKPQIVCVYQEQDKNNNNNNNTGAINWIIDNNNMCNGLDKPNENIPCFETCDVDWYCTITPIIPIGESELDIQPIEGFHICNLDTIPITIDYCGSLQWTQTWKCVQRDDHTVEHSVSDDCPPKKDTSPQDITLVGYTCVYSCFDPLSDTPEYDSTCNWDKYRCIYDDNDDSNLTDDEDTGDDGDNVENGGESGQDDEDDVDASTGGNIIRDVEVCGYGVIRKDFACTTSPVYSKDGTTTYPRDKKYCKNVDTNGAINITLKQGICINMGNNIILNEYTYKDYIYNDTIMDKTSCSIMDTCQFKQKYTQHPLNKLFHDNDDNNTANTIDITQPSPNNCQYSCDAITEFQCGPTQRDGLCAIYHKDNTSSSSSSSNPTIFTHGSYAESFCFKLRHDTAINYNDKCDDNNYNSCSTRQCALIPRDINGEPIPSAELVWNEDTCTSFSTSICPFNHLECGIYHYGRKIRCVNIYDNGEISPTNCNDRIDIPPIVSCVAFAGCHKEIRCGFRSIETGIFSTSMTTMENCNIKSENQCNSYALCGPSELASECWVDIRSFEDNTNNTDKNGGLTTLEDYSSNYYANTDTTKDDINNGNDHITDIKYNNDNNQHIRPTEKKEPYFIKVDNTYCHNTPNTIGSEPENDVHCTNYNLCSAWTCSIPYTIQYTSSSSSDTSNSNSPYDYDYGSLSPSQCKYTDFTSKQCTSSNNICNMGILTRQIGCIRNSSIIWDTLTCGYTNEQRPLQSMECFTHTGCKPNAMCISSGNILEQCMETPEPCPSLCSDVTTPIPNSVSIPSSNKKDNNNDDNNDNNDDDDKNDNNDVDNDAHHIMQSVNTYIAKYTQYCMSTDGTYIDPSYCQGKILNTKEQPIICEYNQDSCCSSNIFTIIKPQEIDILSLYNDSNPITSVPDTYSSDRSTISTTTATMPTATTATSTSPIYYSLQQQPQQQSTDILYGPNCDKKMYIDKISYSSFTWYRGSTISMMWSYEGLIGLSLSVYIIIPQQAIPYHIVSSPISRGYVEFTIPLNAPEIIAGTEGNHLILYVDKVLSYDISSFGTQSVSVISSCKDPTASKKLCGQYGSCIIDTSNHNTDTCICQPGWYGKTCNISQCNKNTCFNGYCSNNQLQCICYDGYYGTRCEKYEQCIYTQPQLSSSSSSSPSNNKQLFIIPENERAPVWAQQFAISSKDALINNDYITVPYGMAVESYCSYHGSILPISSSPKNNENNNSNNNNQQQQQYVCDVCQCYNNWSGNRCETCTLRCPSNTQPNQQCTQCHCLSGYTGKTCECYQQHFTIHYHDAPEFMYISWNNNNQDITYYITQWKNMLLREISQDLNLSLDHLNISQYGWNKDKTSFGVTFIVLLCDSHPIESSLSSASSSSLSSSQSANDMSHEHKIAQQIIFFKNKYNRYIQYIKRSSPLIQMKPRDILPWISGIVKLSTSDDKEEEIQHIEHIDKIESINHVPINNSNNNTNIIQRISPILYSVLSSLTHQHSSVDIHNRYQYNKHRMQNNIQPLSIEALSPYDQTDLLRHKQSLATSGIGQAIANGFASIEPLGDEYCTINPSLYDSTAQACTIIAPPDLRYESPYTSGLSALIIFIIILAVVIVLFGIFLLSLLYCSRTKICCFKTKKRRLNTQGLRRQKEWSGIYRDRDTNGNIDMADLDNDRTSGRASGSARTSGRNSGRMSGRLSEQLADISLSAASRHPPTSQVGRAQSRKHSIGSTNGYGRNRRGKKRSNTRGRRRGESTDIDGSANGNGYDSPENSRGNSIERRTIEQSTIQAIEPGDDVIRGSYNVPLGELRQSQHNIIINNNNNTNNNNNNNNNNPRSSGRSSRQRRSTINLAGFKRIRGIQLPDGWIVVTGPNGRNIFINEKKCISSFVPPNSDGSLPDVDQSLFLTEDEKLEQAPSRGSSRASTRVSMRDSSIINIKNDTTTTTTTTPTKTTTTTKTTTSSSINTNMKPASTRQSPILVQSVPENERLSQQE